MIMKIILLNSTFNAVEGQGGKIMFNEFRPQKRLHQTEFIFLLIELYICTAEGADINLNVYNNGNGRRCENAKFKNKSVEKSNYIV